MWSAQDIRGLLLMSGFVGIMIGAMGVALYVSIDELKNAQKTRGA